LLVLEHGQDGTIATPGHVKRATTPKAYLLPASKHVKRSMILKIHFSWIHTHPRKAPRASSHENHEILSSSSPRLSNSFGQPLRMATEASFLLLPVLPVFVDSTERPTSPPRNPGALRHGPPDPLRRPSERRP